MKRILLILTLISVICVSCTGKVNTGKALPLPETSYSTEPTTPDLNVNNEAKELNICWHLEREQSVIEEWENLISMEANMKISISNYANNRRLSQDGDVLNDNSNFIYPEDNTEKIIYYMTQIDGLYLISVNDYLRMYAKREKYFHPFTNLSVISEIDEQIIAGLYDDSGELWCLPREIIDPIVWVRYYNQDAVDKLGISLPETLSQLFNTFSEAKKQGYSPIKIKEPFSMPYKLLDIFAAFNIDYNLYPIRYCNDKKGFIDQLATDNMKYCIEFLCSLVDAGLIEFGNDDNSEELLFSNIGTFTKLDYYSINLFNDIHDYESHEYYEPVSYVYVTPKETKKIDEIDRFTRQMYLTDSMYLRLRFGDEDGFQVSHNKIYIDNYEKLRPNLIGSLPGKDYYPVYKINSEDVLNEKYRIIEESKNGYYQQIPVSQYVYTDSATHMGEVLANDFKKMLYDYLTSEERVSIDDLINKYITKAKSAGLLEEFQRLNYINGTGLIFDYSSE